MSGKDSKESSAGGAVVLGLALTGYAIYRGVKYLLTDHEKIKAEAEAEQERQRAERQWAIWTKQEEKRIAERREFISRLRKKAAGRDFCPDCETIEPDRCGCGNCGHCYGNPCSMCD